MSERDLTPEEQIERKLDALHGARVRAAETSRCRHCHRPATMAVDHAERDLIATIERLSEERRRDAQAVV